MVDKFIDDSSVIDELAVIFESEYTEDGFCYEYPVDVVYGYYNEEDDRFVDSNLYTYSHVSRGEDGKAYALRLKINDLSCKYPDKGLNEIRNIIFDEYSKYRYYISFFQDEPIIVMENLETKNTHVLLDVDTIENLMFLTDNKDIEEFMLNFEEEEFLEKENAMNDLVIKKDTTDKLVVKNNKTKLNPHKLYREIRKTVKGQDEAIKRIVTVIWENYSSNKNANNMIVLGSSGVGKTEIFRQLSKILDVPLFIFGATGMSQAGYKGIGTDEILANLLTFTKGDVEKAERAIVILDEFDKIAYKGYESGKVSTEGVQNELLKIVEDGTFVVEVSENGFPVKKTINTSHITFVGIGAFTDTLKVKKDKSLGFGNDITSKEISKKTITSEDLINFGITPELVGRMGVGGIIKLNDLTIDILKDIISNSSNSAYNYKVKFIEENIPKFIRKNEDEIVETIAKIVINSPNKIGVRGLAAIIENMFSDILFDISNPDENYQELEITKDTVNDPKKYVLRK